MKTYQEIMYDYEDICERSYYEFIDQYKEYPKIDSEFLKYCFFIAFRDGVNFEIQYTNNLINRLQNRYNEDLFQNGIVGFVSGAIFGLVLFTILRG